MSKHKIEWLNRPGTTGVTWSPVTGCSSISEGCTHCWAERMSKRLAGRHGYPRNEAVCPICGESYDRVEPFCPEHPNTKLERTSSFDVTLHPDKLDAPLHWKKPRTVFVCSMSDLFHEDVPDEYIASVFGVMALARHHTFMVLTKRPTRMLELLTGYLSPDELWGWRDEMIRKFNPWRPTFDWLSGGGYQDTAHPGNPAFIEHLPLEFYPEPDDPLSNVWLGVTAENQKRADERIPLLLQCPAAVRFVSIEPMLEKIDLPDIHVLGVHHQLTTGHQVLFGSAYGKRAECLTCGVLHGLDWVIVGGETGPGARTMDPGWAREIKRQCQEAGTPFFFKQMSKKAPIPDDLMVRQWPQ